MLAARLIFANSLLILILLAGQPPEPILRTRIALDGFIREPQALMKVRRHTIGGMSFSHSGRKVAVVAGGHTSGKMVLGHVLVVDLEKPQPAVTVFDVSNSIPGCTNRLLQWSEDDRLLLYNCFHQAILIDGASTVSRCFVNNKLTDISAAGFVGGSQFFVWEWASDKEPVYFYDFDCRFMFERNLSGSAAPYGASMDSLIVLAHHLGMSILRAPDWEPKPVADEIYWARPVLLQNGQTLCAGHSPNGGDGSMKCWSLQGNEIQPRGTYAVRKGGTVPISGAANSTLVAFLESAYSYNGFTEGSKTRPKRYVVWDAESRKTIFELPPREQDEFRSYESRRKSKIPFDIAISPDGSLLALGGDDVLEIYTLPH